MLSARARIGVRAQAYDAATSMRLNDIGPVYRTTDE